MSSRPSLAGGLAISLLLVASTLASTVASAQEGAGKAVIVPENRQREYGEYHYAPAVRVGDRVILSGIPAGGPGTYKEQVRRLFTRVKNTLAAAGAGLDDIIEIQTFHVNPKHSDEFGKELREFIEVYGEFVTGAYPAWTAIGNAVLLAQGAVLEMRVEAVAGAGKTARVEKVPAIGLAKPN